ncbi:hypothetical protein T11_9069 [Trichinella zimbabwensis]|uniref:Uncharacterized protein n=1 Tax=Trichinella zimbabwensis TaxID=268475 RepID=A0A0V1DPK1_9BILA|nr:hypothetical protein T11_9069 [Trichinella zimbabwensis]
MKGATETEDFHTQGSIPLSPPNADTIAYSSKFLLQGP